MNETVKTHTPLPWHVEQSPTDPEMFAVVGHYLVADALPIEDAKLIAASKDLLTLAHQYASDLRHPPSADSVERRLERIAAVLAKVGV